MIAITEFKKKLGQRIRQLREEANLTQIELANRMEFRDKQVINRYEKTGANPTAFSLWQIAHALDVSIDELLDFKKLDQ